MILHKNILTSEFKPKGFLAIHGCFNGATSSTSDCRSRGTQVEPRREQSLFPIWIAISFFFRHFSQQRNSRVRFPPRKSISPPPSPTMLSKCCFFSFKNWKAFVNTKLSAKQCTFLKVHLYKILCSNPTQSA